MKFYVGVTDNKWFEFLASRKPDEVNFWRPGGSGSFQIIPPGAPFLFKLHSPDNFIAGGGFFVSHSNLPLSLAWEAFGEKNGAVSLEALQAMIEKFRSNKPPEHDPVIGCTILANPFFLRRGDWIPAPSNWAPSIVQGKSYESEWGGIKGVGSLCALRLTGPSEPTGSSKSPNVPFQRGGSHRLHCTH